MVPVTGKARFQASYSYAGPGSRAVLALWRRPAPVGDGMSHSMNNVLAANPEKGGRAPAALSSTTTVMMAVLLVGVIYLGREVLMPVALAVLMSFVLAPLVTLLLRITCRASLQCS
jgi:hypothetical protein